MMTAQIEIFTIKVNAVGRASRIVVSSAEQRNMLVHNKKNQGFGEQNADGCLVLLHKGLLWDQDLVDSSIQE